MADSTSNDKAPQLFKPQEKKRSQKRKDNRHPVDVNTFQKHVADQVIEWLKNDDTIYQRAGWLVQIVNGQGETILKGRKPKPRIRPLALATLQERMAHSIRFQMPAKSEDGAGGKESVRAIHPPAWCVRAIHARGEWHGIRSLEALADFPLWLAGGRILTKPGHDPDSGVYLNYCGPKIAVPSRVTKGEAHLAAAKLLELVCDFPFETQAHKVAWLAAAMTPISRFAFAGPVPFFLCDANVPAAGKGKLMNCIARILSGSNFAVAPYPTERSEWAKTITAYAIGGYPWVFFDNLKDRLGDANLDAVLTNPHWESRMLGGNQIISEPLYLVFYATGNNVTLEGDIGRRTCHIRLSSPYEHPEDRKDFVHADLEGEIDARRGELLGCLLTIFRGYEQAGRPAVQMLPWGSFEAWSECVRAPLVWLGYPDPAATFRQLQQAADSDAGDVEALAYFWECLQDKTHGMTCRDFLAAMNQQNDMRMTLADFDSASDLLASLFRDPNSRTLGQFLHKYRGRLFGGRRFVTAHVHRGTIMWRVETVGEAISPAPE